MAILGLVSKGEHQKVLQEIETLKASLSSYERWLLETARAERYNIPDPSVYGNQADLYRTLSWVLLAVGGETEIKSMPRIGKLVAHPG